MGRYYSGDIEGKFWFGVQSSNDADHFGVIGQTPNYLEYHFIREDEPAIRKGIKECRDHLGHYKKRLDNFFRERASYNDDMLRQEGIPVEKLEYYARLLLGKEILKCVQETGQCSFVAEL